MNMFNDLNKADWFDESKPTFVFKINVGGLSRQRVEEQHHNMYNEYQTSNANIIILPVGNNGDNSSTSVECIHGGSKSVESEFMKNMLENTLDFDNTFLDEVVKSKKFDDSQIQELKFLLRKHKLKILIDDSEVDED